MSFCHISKANISIASRKQKERGSIINVFKYFRDRNNSINMIIQIIWRKKLLFKYVKIIVEISGLNMFS